MANAAAYTGLRRGELATLTIGQVDVAARVIAVDRKVIEVAGHLYVEPPKNRKQRRTIYPRTTPAGYPLADPLEARTQAARAEQDAGVNPLGLIFPSPAGKHWRSSNLTATSCSAPTARLDGATSAAAVPGLMSETDLHQPGLGPLRAAAEAAELAQAVSGLASADGYRLADRDPLAPLAREIARSMTEAGLTVHRCAAHDPGYRPGGVCLLAVPAGPAAGGGGVAVSWTTHSPLSLDWDRYGTCTGTQQARRRSPIPRGPTAQAVSPVVPSAHGCRPWDGPHR